MTEWERAMPESVVVAWDLPEVCGGEVGKKFWLRDDAQKSAQPRTGTKSVLNLSFQSKRTEKKMNLRLRPQLSMEL
jgi:hypothetical protein